MTNIPLPSISKFFKQIKEKTIIKHMTHEECTQMISLDLQEAT